jgi:hypothetical protein
MPLSAARARGLERLLLEVTALALVAIGLVTPALGSEGHGKAPAAPARLAVAQTTQTAISWGWEPSDAAVAYRAYEDGGFVEQTTGTTSTFDGLECGRAYALGVEAIDGKGRRSDQASVTAATAPCETPAVSEPAPIPQPAQTPTPLPAPEPPPASPSEPPTDTSDPPAPDSGQPATKDTTPSLWQTAGAFVWHETAVDPEQLGRELRDNGFGWVAVDLHDGMSVDPVEDDWLRRFREASGLPVGGWGVLRTEPEAEAQLASSLLDRYSLSFYIADAESEYKYGGDDGSSAVRYGRSKRFVDAFRALRPDLPAAISSYCRADRMDIDWKTWASAGFEFMPQAYVNDFGDGATPAACAEGAAAYFQADAVHPTIGMYPGQEDVTTPETYANLLQAAHTVGFSVYLAETHMASTAWNVLGNAISNLGIAARFGSHLPDQQASDQP